MNFNCKEEFIQIGYNLPSKGSIFLYRQLVGKFMHGMTEGVPRRFLLYFRNWLRSVNFLWSFTSPHPGIRPFKIHIWSWQIFDFHFRHFSFILNQKRNNLTCVFAYLDTKLDMWPNFIIMHLYLIITILTCNKYTEFTQTSFKSTITGMIWQLSSDVDDRSINTYHLWQ